MARRKKHHRRRRGLGNLLGRASKHCAGKGKRARKKCMKAYFSKH